MRTTVAREEAPEYRHEPPPPAHRSAAQPRSAGGGGGIYGMYLREIRKIPRLSPAEEVELAARVKRGDKAAREKLITANLRLVGTIAREYEGYGLPALDLISEGTIGLMRAVTRFDPAKGAKLSTYAAWWIKQAIKRALANQSKTVRVPVHVLAKLAILRRVAKTLQEELGHEPDATELAEETGLPLQQVTALRALILHTVSLDKPLNEEGDETFATVFADENGRTPDQDLESREMAQTLGQAINRLSAREQRILRARFGLANGSERTLRELGAYIGLTHERVRKIQNVALAKLRRSLQSAERRGDTGAFSESEEVGSGGPGMRGRNVLSSGR